jgi:hypothetical protein
LLVALDDARWPDHGFVGILAGLAAGSTLPQQIPTLIERNFDLAPPFGFFVREPFAGVGSFEGVLLLCQLPDPFNDVGFIHVGRSFVRVRDLQRREYSITIAGSMDPRHVDRA